MKYTRHIFIIFFASITACVSGKDISISETKVSQKTYESILENIHFSKFIDSGNELGISRPHHGKLELSGQCIVFTKSGKSAVVIWADYASLDYSDGKIFVTASKHPNLGSVGFKAAIGSEVELMGHWASRPYVYDPTWMSSTPEADCGNATMISAFEWRILN